MLNILMLGIWELFGVTFFIVGILGLNDIKKKKIKCTLNTHGKVINIVEHKCTDASGRWITVYRPVFEYNIGERRFVKESLAETSELKYTIGQEVEVFYNPEDYDEYYIVGDTLQKTLLIIFTIVGVVVTIFGIYFGNLIL